MSPASTELTTADREPVASYTAIATVVALAAGAVGVTVDPGTLVTGALAVVGFGSYIVAAIKARKKVTPIAFPNLSG